MKAKKEKNISAFNKDVETLGHYAYTNKDSYSLITARNRQVTAIVQTVKEYFSKDISMLDVGCGDGQSTFLLMERIKAKKIVGFDAAKSAVLSATKQTPQKYKGLITFKTLSIYDADKELPKNTFDITVIWGVLHHLYKPQKAINSIGKITKKIVILETNGYNPILKIIEKVSPYHRAHEEKSYFPFLLNYWFKEAGFVVKKKEYCGIVPYFCPKLIARFLKFIEPFIEKIPLLREICCGSILLYYEKT